MNDLGPNGVERILNRAVKHVRSRAKTVLPHKPVVGLLFFQASTRTRVGFAVATERIGGASIELWDTKHQPSMSSPESLTDTVRVVGDYCDLLVLRHQDDQAVAELTDVSPVPLVSGGAGQRFHPTQALIDLYAIRKYLGRLESLRIGLVGDLSSSRTAHSLLRALAWYSPAEVRLMAPEGRSPANSVLQGLPIEVVSTNQNSLHFEGLDLLYVAGTPPGEGKEILSPEVRKQYYLTPERLTTLPSHSIVLCALPRTGDIETSVDNDPRCKYFEQSRDGLFVRMAVLEHYLGLRRIP